MSPEEARWDVFLAHASADKPRARILYQALTALGLKVFLDEESLLPGDDWMDDIPRALRASDLVVVLVSALTANAHYAGEEIVISIAETRAGRQRLVPVHIERDVEDPYGTARKNRIDWHDEADVDAVVTQLSRVIPRVVQGLTRATADAPIFSRRVPVPPPHFTGRDELLTQLAAQLGGGRPTTLTQEIQGMGGVGKTTVAAALCEDQRMHHDIVWWVRAEDPGTLVADLAELAGHIGATTGQGGDADADAVVALLETTDRSWLVVYDNVPDRESVLRWLPRRGPGTPVVTTRYRHLGLGTLVTVGILSDDTTEAFLRERVRERNAIAADEPLGPVLDRVRGLPLAMEQAAAWVARKPNRRFSQWVDLYDERADLAFPDGTKPVDYEHTAVTAWRVSIDAAGKESPLAERLLGALGHFAPEGIALQWLKDAAGDPYLDGATSDDVGAAIDALDDYDLVTIHPDDTLDVHRIIHDTARRTASEGAALFAVGAMFSQAARAMNAKDQRMLVALAPHLRQDRQGFVGGGQKYTAALVMALASIAKASVFEGKLREGLDTAMFAVEAARTIPDTVPALRADDALATVFQYSGDPKRAIPLFESALAASEKSLGTHHLETVTIRGNLAGAYGQVGGHAMAVRLNEETFAEYEQTYGKDHLNTFTSRSNLANSYARAGDLDRSIALFEAMLADAERVLGDRHITTLRGRNSLAAVHHTKGDYDRAIDLYEASNRGFENTLGPHHPETLTCQSNLAMAHIDSGDWQRGLDLLETVLVTCEAELEPSHPLTARVRRAAASRSPEREDEETD